MSELNELIAKAKWCADLMRADGITAEHVAVMTEAQKEDLAISYMAAVGRKIEEIQSICLTRDGATESMAQYVRALL